MVVVGILFACRGGAAPPSVVSDTADTAVQTGPLQPERTGSDGPTADTGAPISTGDTGPPIEPFDCTAPLPTPTWTLLPDTPRAEEFDFDAYGNLIAVDSASGLLLQVTYAGKASVVAPYEAIELAGTRVLIDGDYAIADEWNGTITRNSPKGSRSTLVTGLNSPNSLAVGNDGHLYYTAFDAIHRVDLATDLSEVLFTLPNSDLDGLTFSPDFSALYFNHDDAGTVGRMQFDVNRDVIREEIVAHLPSGWGHELDGMVMDVCSNLYVVRTDGILYRLQLDGTLDTVVDLNSGFTSAAHFGSGIGGWAHDYIYLMDRSQGVWEVDIGVPGASLPHLPAVP